MIKAKCKCNANFTTMRGIQVDVEIDKNGEHIKDIFFGDYYDNIGENTVKCIKCGKEAEVVDDDEI